MACSSHERDPLLSEQIEYYRARAAEYDDWFYRRDRYDRGAEHKRRWFADSECIRTALSAAEPSGNVLELACGTGIWTQELAGRASHLVAVDASPEVLAINRTKVGDPSVDYVLADLFEWNPKTKFDFIFFGFWHSHVPPRRFEHFWEKVRSCLAPAGTVFFVDSARHQEYRPLDQVERGETEWVARRDLRDGREFDIVKVFYDPDSLTRRLSALGWEGPVRQTKKFFIYAALKRSSDEDTRH